ncbi:MAG: glutamate racemase [Vampirovibrionia bacterium]
MNSENTLRLAFYDSGIGGFSVLREFLKFFKDINKETAAQGVVTETNLPGLKIEIHYIADSARAPYGARSLEDIKRYVQEFSDFAANLGIDYFISACNTSSNLFEDLDFSAYKFKTLNLFTALNSFLEKEKETLALANLYYLATKANIASGKYKNLVLKVNPLACPKLVPLIEKFNFDEALSVLETEYLGNVEDDENAEVGVQQRGGTVVGRANSRLTRTSDRSVLQVHEDHEDEENAEVGVQQQSRDILILGCTHYALLKHLLGKYSIIDPAELILKEFSKSFTAGTISSINLNTYSTGENSSLMVSTKELTVSSET